jgi:hypothetical protein
MTPDTKLFLVVTVLAVILAGVYVYLFILDRKISKTERMLKNEQETSVPKSEA